MYDTQQHASAVRKAHVFDVQKLEEFMSKHVSGFVPPLKVSQFNHGQSNPTFLLTDAKSTRYVLRKKPPGRLLNKAHAVDREYRVMQALGKVNFPVPKLHTFCDDDSVIGTPFYIMEFVTGRVITNPSAPDMSENDRRKVYEEFGRVLGRLHSVKYADIGLKDYGIETDYFARQIATWTKQYRAAATERIESMENLIKWLPTNIPPGEEVCSIAHGDFKLDNVIFHSTEPRILAVLDWELSTLGHPLADLAYACLPYHIALNGAQPLKDLAIPGLPTEDEFVKCYCQQNGRKYPVAKWYFYLAFSMFRLASIAQGVYARSLQGNASSTTASSYGAVARYLGDTAWETIEKGEQAETNRVKAAL